LNNTYKEDEVYETSTGDYNVFYNYYRLLLSIAGIVNDTEDFEAYISGTLTGTLIVNTDTVKAYSLAYLDGVTRIVLGKNITYIPENTFTGSTHIVELILKHEGEVVTVQNQATLEPLRHKTIRVPSDLVASYQAANIWKNSYLDLTFVAI
jgi:hypothetical protein